MSLLVYSASAGSGKTYTLSLKYISMALLSEKPSAFASILAVTFTNKASGEMKDRILGQLYNLAHDGLDRGFLADVARETHLSEAEVCRRARGVLYAIMHDYDHFRVETIDTFFQSLLTNMAHELRLSRGFKVDLDDKRVIGMAVDRLLLTLRERGNKALIDMVTNFMDRHIDDDKGWNIARDLKTFAQNNLFSDTYVKYDTQFEAFASDPKLINQLHTSLRQFIEDADLLLFHELQKLPPIIAHWGEIRQRTGISTVANFVKSALRKGPLNVAPPATIGKVANDAEALFAKKDTPSDQQIADAQAISSHLNTLLNMMGQFRRPYFSCKLILQNLDTLGLLGAISREVTDLTSEEGTFLLARTPELFSRMVKGSDASFVFEKAGTTFKHIMIDEFQDTSRMQWQNFKTLLFENQAQGDESMLVGDIKQSIYRWRGGDWKILFDIKDEMPGARVEPKVDNFRSLPTVVRFNNVFFAKTAFLADGRTWSPPTDWLTNPARMMPSAIDDTPAEEGLTTIFQRIYKDVEQTPRSKKGTGYVRLETFDTSTTLEEIMAQLHEAINLLHTNFGVPYKEMLILVRHNREAANIINYFSPLDVDFQLTSEQAYFYTSSGMVMSLVYILKFINDPHDTLALTLFEQAYDSLFANLADDDLQKIFSDVREAMKESLLDENTLAEWTRMPLYELLQHLSSCLHFQILERALKGGQTAYLLDFFDAVLSFQDDHVANISNFLVFWDETLVRHTITTSSTDAIQIMTIHKAKGLEAHTVFIPFAHFSTEKDHLGDIIWYDNASIAAHPSLTEGKDEEESELKKVFKQLPAIPLSTQTPTMIKDSNFAANYEVEHLQMRIDALNELYVAFTRARNNLLVWSKKPTQSYKKTTFYWVDAFINDRQPADDYSDRKKTSAKFTPTAVSFGTLEPYQAKAEVATLNPFDKPREKSIDVPYQSGGLHSVSFLQSGKATEFIADTRHQAEGTEADHEAYEQTLKQREYINQGLLYHALFSKIATINDVDQALSSMIREGIVSTRKQVFAMRKTVCEALKQPEVAHWFDGTYQLFNECSILYRNDQGMVMTQRPDRVMISDEEAIVVDYKFGNEKRSYNRQVSGYMNRLSHLLSKPVRGYLWYVFEGKIEEVKL